MKKFPSWPHGKQVDLNSLVNFRGTQSVHVYVCDDDTTSINKNSHVKNIFSNLYNHQVAEEDINVNYKSIKYILIHIKQVEI